MLFSRFYSKVLLLICFATGFALLGRFQQITHSASLANVSATLSNARPSFRGALASGNVEGSSQVHIQTAAGSYPSTSATHLQVGDSVSIGMGGGMGSFAITEVTSDGSFTINEPLGTGQATVGSDIISTQSALLKVHFSTANAVENGAFRVLVPSHSAEIVANDGIPDAGGFDTYGTPWYRAGSAPRPVAAYQAIGASSLNASYTNLVNPGVNSLSVMGTPPAWTPQNGWYSNSVILAGLDTGRLSYYPNDTVILRYVADSDWPMSNSVIVGTGSTNALRIFRNNQQFMTVAQAQILPLTGVVAINNDGVYVNGTMVSSAYNVGSGQSSSSLKILRSTDGQYYRGSVGALAVYNVKLTAKQISAVSTAVSALDENSRKVSCPSQTAGYTFDLPVISPASVVIDGQTYHSFLCPYTGTGGVGTAFDGQSNDPIVISNLINPAPDVGHTQGTADTYPVIVQHLDNSSNIVDQTTVKIGVIDAVKVTASVEPQITFQVFGVDSGQSRCGQTTSVATTPTVVPFGTLLINQFRYAAQSLVVSTNAANGYSVTAQANDQLGRNGASCIGDPGNADPIDSDCIPDSTAVGISHTTPVTWNSSADKGFGYSLHNVSASGATPVFEHSTNAGACVGSECYRQFADAEGGEVAQPVFTSNAPADSHTVDVCYKAVISPLQAAGRYENFITYTTTATF